MKICYLTPCFPPKIGGAELVTESLARQFTLKGHRVVVMAYSKHRVDDDHWPYEVIRYHKSAFPRMFPAKRLERKLRRLHERCEFDVFLVNFGYPTGYAAVRYGQAVGVPTVVVSHGGDLHPSSADRAKRHRFRRLTYAYRHADGLVAISPYIEELILELNPKPRRLASIPNGVDAEELTRPARRPSDFDERRPFILCLGALRPMKGFEEAIRAFAAVCQELGETCLVIVGDGRLRSHFEQLIRDLRLGQRVFLAGRRTGEDKRWFLQNSSFGLMPSIEEGHPMVALEFLAAGKPVIASTCKAFDGTYDDGVNGLRVPMGEVGPLADAILRLSRTDRAAMERECRSRAAEVSWSHIADQYLEFLDHVVTEHRGI